MPHQCTGCGHTFPDGSKQMLSGCPECGGNKFQYFRGDPPPEPLRDANPPDRPEQARPVAEAVGRAANTVRDIVGSDPEYPATDGSDSGDRVTDSSSTTDPASPDPEDDSEQRPDPTDREWPEVSRPDEREDPAQADARTGFFAGDELTRTESTDPEPDLEDIRIAEEEPLPSEQVLEGDQSDDAPSQSKSAETPGLEELREELNDQFESIRIIEPGQYELNLMELYNREEYIIELQEDGRYVIEVPDTWRE